VRHQLPNVNNAGMPIANNFLDEDCGSFVYQDCSMMLVYRQLLLEHFLLELW
jgi:hypothetical protein